MIATENRLRSATFVEAYSHQNRSKRLLGHRKSIQPMAKRLVLADYDQLHHFIAAGILDAAPVETELLVQTDRLVGGSNAVLVIDDTAIPRKGTHSVGVAAQYASAVGCGLSQ
jgi:SRSO17 transposase